ncbi:unnamed protein product [Dibothriocephalus latus]|uniref:Uncharacterized protein n=1 Tax=Dibothriocephalus latus TaxID=60516 RepID=A0A3P7N513_DIBLA|nr:unnamed protein product [Dibothriocephalus latus]
MGKSKKHKKHSSSSESSPERYEWQPEKDSQPAASGKSADADDALAFDALLSRVATTRTKWDKSAPEVINVFSLLIIADFAQTKQRTVSELNPYWADGGTGLPEDDASTTTTGTKPVLTSTNESWLRRAYDRAEEEAQSSGRSVRSILLDRWDEKIVLAMEEAFSRSRHSRDNRSSRDGYASFV